MVSAVLLIALLAGSLIDIRTRRLPDWITLPLIAFGLAMTLLEAPYDLAANTSAAVMGLAAFWAISTLYRLRRGYDGLGLGDAKLLAAAGAWLGPLYLAPLVFVSALLAIAGALTLRLLGRPVSLQTSMPFGPFLSVGFFFFWFVKMSGWSPI